MKKMVHTLIKNDFYRGGIFITASSFIVSVLNYFFNIMIGRSLGPQGFGEIATLFSYLVIFSVPLTVLSTVIIQKIGSHQDNPLPYIRSLEFWAISKIQKWWIVFILPLGIIPFLPQMTNLVPIVAYSIVPLVYIAFLTTFYDATLQGLRLFFWFSVLSIVTVLVKLAGAALVTIGIGDIMVVVLFLIFASLVKLGSSSLLLRKTYKPVAHHTIPQLQKRLRDVLVDKTTLLTTISVIALMLFSNIDIIIVKKFFSSFEAGIYSSWSLFAKIILYFISPISAVSFIFFTSNKNIRKEHQTLIGSLIALAVVGLGSYIAYTFLSQFIIRLFFGSQYDAVIPYLSQASLFGTFYTAITFINNYFIAKQSKAALILPALIPFYAIVLISQRASFSSIFHINVWFAGLVTFIYIIIYVIIYKNARGDLKTFI